MSIDAKIELTGFSRTKTIPNSLIPITRYSQKSYGKTMKNVKNYRTQML